MPPRFKQRTDTGQASVVATLRKLGITVETGHDDMLCGRNGITLWVEWKSDRATSKRTGKVLESGIKPSQKKIRETFSGAYLITNRIQDITDFFGIKYTE